EQNERDLALYRERQNAMSLDEKQNVVQTHYLSLSDQLNKARQAKAQKQALWEQVRSLMASGASPEVIPAVAQNPQVVSAKVKLTTLQSELTQLKEKYGDKHPRVSAANTAV